uniref:Soluble scavenger receptor cysteine-rich domain-containing protein SSC5D n=1 Tax=Callorhinchus milii TaxID=7868 RepID=A0A4W3HF15_CALMI
MHCFQSTLITKAPLCPFPGPVPVRVVNGNNMCSGRVEVLHNSTWGSVCGDHWGTEEANVVCRLLNCGEATSATGNATFGQGTGPVWLSDVRCEGSEAALDQCPAKPYGNNNCSHSQDAGVTCSGKVSTLNNKECIQSTGLFIPASPWEKGKWRGVGCRPCAKVFWESCGIVVRALTSQARGPGFDSRVRAKH